MPYPFNHTEYGNLHNTAGVYHTDMRTSMLQSERFPDDVLYEILANLPVRDILRARSTCKRVQKASYERSVWVAVYYRGDLLVPPGPFSSQSAVELEHLLVRATIIKEKWGGNNSNTSPSRRTFPTTLPDYGVTADLISGRHLMIATADGIQWFDLDRSTEDWSDPILEYICGHIVAMPGSIYHQVNAAGEGENVVWVSFVRINSVIILKVKFVESQATLHKFTELSFTHVSAMVLGHDFLLPIKEFNTLDDPMVLFHIPTKRIFYLPMHARIRSLSDLNYMRYAIIDGYLIMMYSVLRSETLLDVYRLPNVSSKNHSQASCLVRSHQGVYPSAISQVQYLRAQNREVQLNSNVDSSHCVSFLALIYLEGKSPLAWSSKIGFHLIDMYLEASGTLSFLTRSSTTLKIGIGGTNLASTSRGGACLAITHSVPGPVLQTYCISYGRSSHIPMTVKPLRLPDCIQSRELLAFDGIRGRVCLIHGWSQIEILDYYS